MADSTRTYLSAVDLLDTLRHVANTTRQLETVLDKLFQLLQKKGIHLTVDVESMLSEISQGLAAAENRGREVSDQLEQLQKLVHASALISSSLELDQVLEHVMDTVISLTGAERAYLVLKDPETEELITRAARNWEQETLPERDVIISRSVVQAALDQGEPIVTTNAQDDERFQARQSVISYGLRSVLCIPLILKGQAFGVLYADNHIRQGIFSKDRIPQLAAFGTQAAIAIDKARLHEEELRRQKLEEELAVGRQIQFSMLPKSVPDVPGWEFAVAYQPTRLVGGDFYDFFTLPGDGSQIGIVVADVADKGVPAALFMALSRTMIRTTALSGRAPAAAFIQANELILKDSDSGLFLTAFYAALDTTTGHMVYTNAGHNRPLWWRAEAGEFQELRVPGIVLGLFERIALSDREIEVQPGDVLVFYTDGATEAMDSQEREFGEKHLREVIYDHCDGTAQEILNAITSAIRVHTDDTPQFDDLTLVVAKRNAV